eukprot:m51a1_g198 putative rala-binding protein 1 isoform x2 (433) ;mRNA; r:655253-656622
MLTRLGALAGGLYDYVTSVEVPPMPSPPRPEPPTPPPPPPPVLSPVFGVAFDVAARRSDGDDWLVPAPLRDAVAYLSSCGGRYLDSEGLYRVPGDYTFLRALTARYDRGERWRPPASPYSAWQQDEAAGIVLAFLGALPEGQGLWDPAREALQRVVDGWHEGTGEARRDAGFQNEAAAAIRRALGSLSAPRRQTLRVLLAHLHEVVSRSQRNRMSLQALAVCGFGHLAAACLQFPLDAVLPPPTLVFGVPLADAVSRSPGAPSDVPYAVRACAEFVDAQDGECEGVYIRAEQSERVLEARYALNCGQDPGFSPGEARVASATLLRYLSELAMSPGPLMSDVEEQILSATSEGCDPETGELEHPLRLEVIARVIGHLAPANLATLSYLVAHFKRVVKDRKRYGVTLGSLCTALGPSWAEFFPVLLAYSESLFT